MVKDSNNDKIEVVYITEISHVEDGHHLIDNFSSTYHFNIKHTQYNYDKFV